jgi:hypothetical protein
MNIPCSLDFCTALRRRKQRFAPKPMRSARDLRDQIVREARRAWLQANIAYQRLGVTAQLVAEAKLASRWYRRSSSKPAQSSATRMRAINIVGACGPHLSGRCQPMIDSTLAFYPYKIQMRGIICAVCATSLLRANFTGAYTAPTFCIGRIIT